jgi:hypothetical protein
MLKENYSMLNRKRQGLLKKMGNVGPFIMATISEYKTKCANKECRCHKNHKKYGHQTCRISWTDSQGNGACYVPVDLRDEVKEWIENYWEMKEYMKEMTSLSRRMIKMYSKTLGRGKRNLKKRG